MAEEEAEIKTEGEKPLSEDDPEDTGEVIGSAAMRPVFLGNLNSGYTPEEIMAVFEKPVQPKPDEITFEPMAVDRIDQKRGYCFVFLKDAMDQADKERAESFVAAVHGM